jgi:hypothetical protein
METLRKNWKTTLGGFVVLAVLALQSQGIITPEVGTLIYQLATGLGLIAASDGSVVSQLAAGFWKDSKY